MVGLAAVSNMVFGVRLFIKKLHEFLVEEDSAYYCYYFRGIRYLTIVYDVHIPIEPIAAIF